MNRKIYSLIGCCIFTIAAYAQKEIGAEYQHGFGKSYNSNSVGAIYEGFSTGRRGWQIALHYTWDTFVADKKTSGVSDLGLSIGYRYGFSYSAHGNIIAGVRATFSFLTETDHTKLTPSVELGYHYTFNHFLEKGGFATPSFAFGYDHPIGKENAGDYKGTVFIPRIAVGYRF